MEEKGVGVLCIVYSMILTRGFDRFWAIFFAAIFIIFARFLRHIFQDILILFFYVVNYTL